MPWEVRFAYGGATFPLVEGASPRDFVNAFTTCVDTAAPSEPKLPLHFRSASDRVMFSRVWRALLSDVAQWAPAPHQWWFDGRQVQVSGPGTPPIFLASVSDESNVNRTRRSASPSRTQQRVWVVTVTSTEMHNAPSKVLGTYRTRDAAVASIVPYRVDKWIEEGWDEGEPISEKDRTPILDPKNPNHFEFVDFSLFIVSESTLL